MFELHNLTSSGKKSKRIGRGGSRGGTSGKGHKGQKARSGGSISARFEGGQMPLFRRLPKRGFNNASFSPVVEIVNVGQLDRFQDGAEVTIQDLGNEGLITLKKGSLSTKKVLVKVLGQGAIKKKLTVHAHAFSASARKAIEEIGGTVIVD